MSKSSYSDLLSQDKRLIVLQDAAQYSSYSDGPYTTINGHSIADLFPKFLAGTQIAVWQCQATPTNIMPVAVYTAVAANSDVLAVGHQAVVRRDYAAPAAGQCVSSDAGYDAAGDHE